ncbi:MAG: hypothetical protein PHI31_04790 [Desulfuromonadaceae bacterium]|nr:hypothetical protein [Desulfuromonadaceae bacterium]
MKSVLMAVTVVASLFFSITAFAEEKSTGTFGGYGQYDDYGLSGMKDQCLIVAENCIGGDDSVLKRVERLNNEISKGADVYTPEELKNFQEQLNWIYYESNDFPAVRL